MTTTDEIFRLLEKEDDDSRKSSYSLWLPDSDYQWIEQQVRLGKFADANFSVSRYVSMVLKKHRLDDAEMRRQGALHLGMELTEGESARTDQEPSTTFTEGNPDEEGA